MNIGIPQSNRSWLHVFDLISRARNFPSYFTFCLTKMPQNVNITHGNTELTVMNVRVRRGEDEYMLISQRRCLSLAGAGHTNT